MGPPRPGVARLARRRAHRAARHRRAVAPPMAPAAVDVALPTDTSGAAPYGGDHSRARRPDGRRESDVGRAADSRGIGQAGPDGVGANRVAVAAATASAPSQTWRTFLTNHVATLVSMDFFTVPTLTGRVLFVLVLLAHQRRRIVHINITEHPTAAWTAQQMIEAFPDDTAPRWLLRDRDAIYGDAFRRRVAGMGIGEVLASPSSPWQNPYAETRDRIHSPRVSGSCDRAWRVASATASDLVSQLLSWGANASRLGEGRAHAAPRAAADGRARGRVP